MTLQEAKDYISYGCKEGYFDPDIFFDEEGNFVMKDEEIIKFAEKAEAKADARADSLRDEDMPF